MLDDVHHETRPGRVPPGADVPQCPLGQCPDMRRKRRNPHRIGRIGEKLRGHIVALAAGERLGGFGGGRHRLIGCEAPRQRDG